MIYDRPKKLDTVSITPPLFYCYGISEIKMSESQRFRVIFVYQLSPNGPARSGWSSMLIRIFVMNHYFFFLSIRGHHERYLRARHEFVTEIRLLRRFQFCDCSSSKSRVQKVRRDAHVFLSDTFVMVVLVQWTAT
jgi:hypothetical protein